MSSVPAAPPECDEAPRSRALERRLRRRRQEARLRLRLVADSVLLSQHHASRVPTFSAAPASTPRANEWKREAVELRALLLDMREQLNAWLATRTASSTTAAPASAAGPTATLPGSGMTTESNKNAESNKDTGDFKALEVDTGTPLASAVDGSWAPSTALFRQQPISLGMELDHVEVDKDVPASVSTTAVLPRPPETPLSSDVVDVATDGLEDMGAVAACGASAPAAPCHLCLGIGTRYLVLGRGVGALAAPVMDQVYAVRYDDEFRFCFFCVHDFLSLVVCG